MWEVTARAYKAIFEPEQPPVELKRGTTHGWEHCPNCDAPLGKRIFPGDDWECTECGESGTRPQ
jgi:ribosomal protein L37AE/L43A